MELKKVMAIVFGIVSLLILIGLVYRLSMASLDEKYPDGSNDKRKNQLRITTKVVIVLATLGILEFFVVLWYKLWSFDL